MVTEVLSSGENRMKKAVEALNRELDGVRTGRARPALVEHLSMDYFGVPTPLNQLATISAPEARLIVIQPWDRQVLPNIEKAILKSELGLNPTNDGSAIRLSFPPLSEERRRELVRLVHRKVEEGRVSVRNIRRDEVEKVRGMEKNKELSQDESHRTQDQIQKLTDTYIAQMDRLGQAKEAEVMEV